MDTYNRYVSGEHDECHFTKNIQQGITLRPISGQFDVSRQQSKADENLDPWKDVLTLGVYFHGYDPVCFGHVISIVYKNSKTNRLGVITINKYGTNVFEKVVLKSNSRFWPACENLLPEHQHSTARKLLALTNLKVYNGLWNHPGLLPVARQWDETNAGSLASSMIQANASHTQTLTSELMSHGIVQNTYVTSMTIDLVYENSSKLKRAQNNGIVSQLGTQLALLFDPLLEYSPEYTQNQQFTRELTVGPLLKDNRKISFAINALLHTQNTATMSLVTLVEKFIVPLRIASTSRDVVDQVFPATIDEVSRVNCLLSHSLKLAITFGYVEVFQALSETIPLFYKPFVRHRANLQSFHQNFTRFVKANSAVFSNDSNTSLSNYRPDEIERIVVGFIHHLLNLKPVIEGLYVLIQEEKGKISGYQEEKDTEKNLLQHYHKVIMDTIDAFGYLEGIGQQSLDGIVATTGNLLHELVAGWPGALQTGWANRKLLEVCEVYPVDRPEHPVSTSTNANQKSATKESDNQQNQQLIAIFSDILVIIDVKENPESHRSPSVSGLLMDLLLNRSPVPQLKSFPALSVKYWCDINHVMARSYSSSDQEFISFLAYNGNHFKSPEVPGKNLNTPTKEDSGPVYALSFNVTQPSSPGSLASSRHLCRNILDKISKAQILNKSSPFHLFSSSDSGVSMYYCAHESLLYKDERSKSFISILLNISPTEIQNYFENFPLVSGVLTLNYLNQHTIQISGRNREQALTIDEIVAIQDLSKSLQLILAEMIKHSFHSSLLANQLISQNRNAIGQFLAYSNSIAESRPEDRGIIENLSKSKASPSLKNKASLQSTQFSNYSEYPNSPTIKGNEFKENRRGFFRNLFRNPIEKAPSPSKTKASLVKADDIQYEIKRHSLIQIMPEVEAEESQIFTPKDISRSSKEAEKTEDYPGKMNTINPVPIPEMNHNLMSQHSDAATVNTRKSFTSILQKKTRNHSPQVFPQDTNSTRISTGPRFTGSVGSASIFTGSLASEHGRLPSMSTKTTVETVREFDGAEEKNFDNLRYEAVSTGKTDSTNAVPTGKTVSTDPISTEKTGSTEKPASICEMTAKQITTLKRKVSSKDTARNSVPDVNSIPLVSNGQNEPVVRGPKEVAPQRKKVPIQTPQTAENSAQCPNFTTYPNIKEPEGTVNKDVFPVKFSDHKDNPASERPKTERPNADTVPVNKSVAINKSSVNKPHVNKAPVIKPPVNKSSVKKSEAIPKITQTTTNRKTSSQNAIKELEDTTAIGTSPTIYMRYKAYESLPTSILDNDGKRNWKLISESDPDSSTETFQEPTLATTLLMPALVQFDSDGSFSYSDAVTFVPPSESTTDLQEVTQTKNVFDLTVQQHQKDISSDSLASDYLQDFSSSLNNYFHLDGSLSLQSLNSDLLKNADVQLSSFQTANEVPISRIPDMDNLLSSTGSRATSYSSTVAPGAPMELSVSSSDEEYFSSHDLLTIDFSMAKKRGKSTEELSRSDHGSLLSDRTLMRDLPIDPGSIKGETGKEIMPEDYGSMLYLCDIISGKVVL